MTTHSSAAPTSMTFTRRMAPPPGSGFGEFFRYHGWLSPGIRLFRRIGFPAKSAWVSLAFVVPLVFLLGSLTLTANEQILNARQELDGVRYARPLLGYIQAMQARRLAAALGAPDLAEQEAKVTSAFDALQTAQTEQGKALGVEAAFSSLRQAHEALQSRPTAGGADATLTAHTDLGQATMALLHAVADGAQLSLDPELDTYHLMTVAVLRGPRQVENTSRLTVMGALALTSKSLTPARSHLIEKWTAVRAFLDEDVENSFQTVVAATPEVDKLVDMKGADAASEAFNQAMDSQLLGAQLGADAAAFTALGQAATTAQAQLNMRLLDRLDERLQARVARLQTTLAVQLIFSALCIAVAAYLMLAFYRVMTGGLREVSGHLEEITRGNLTTCPQPWGRDEAAQLMITMGQMQQSLRRIVGIVLDGSGQVQTASREIASASQDLSGRTEQTAANLEQTAASMEEIGSTVKHTADTVAQAMSIVDQNATAAKRGGEVIDQVVKTMDGIQTSSNKIGEIIGVIDSIAFQTNILALNAAVEAARAGEQGRGFAVVATEVRALAGRSATAAREIKALIGASIEQVDNGNRIAAEAGATIQVIVGNAGKISGMMGEIVNATREQSSGVGQVGAAVHELDRTTQQNAALVEQTSAAADALAEQARRLTQEVAFFKMA